MRTGRDFFLYFFFLKNVYLVSDNSIILVIEPFDSITLCNFLGTSKSGLGMSSEADTTAWTSEYNKKVHTVNTNTWVVFDVKINVFLNSKSEASVVAEIAFQ